MTTVLSNATDQETLDRVKDLYVWSAANRFADDDEPITIATLQDWRSRGEVSGPLSRDEFIRMVREQHIDETTIVWEVWDGTRVWPKQQAEKLTLFREAHRAGIFHTKPPPPASTAEPTDGVSADEIVASVLEEIRVESITKSSLLWRLPLFGWLLALCGWKPLSTPIAVMPADSNSESAAMPLSAFVSRSGINPAATTVTADPNTAKIETDIESSSSSTEAAASSLDTFGGLSLDSLDDANSATPAEISELPYTNLRRTVPEASQAGYVGTTDLQSDESSPDGKLDGAIANALNYFDAKAAKSLSHRDKLDAAKPRLVDQLIMAVVSAGRLMIAPFRGLVTLAGKAVASERTLVTGESFQRLDESLRRGLKHPVT